MHTGGFGTGILAGHMSAHLAGDMGIQNDGFIGCIDEERCKKSHGGAAAANTHFGCFFAVDDRRMADLYGEPPAVFNFKFDQLAVGNICDRAGHHKTVLTGQSVDTTDMQHFRAILLGFDHADLTLADQNGIALLANRYVCIHFDDNRTVT